MEESNSLLLNEEALRVCPEPKKPVFVFEWLRYLERILPVTQKADLKTTQAKLIEQLTARIAAGPGPPTRALLARCISRVYVQGDSYQLFVTINACNDALKSKDDTPSQLPVKLTALAVLGSLYEAVGRLVGRSYEESFQHMIKWLKNAESQGREAILVTLASLVAGLGTAAAPIHKEIYKAARTHFADRAMPVRIAAAQCLTALVTEYAPLWTTDLEATCTLCLKALDGSNYETRAAVAKLFARLLATAHQPPTRPATTPTTPANAAAAASTAGTPTAMPIEDCLQLLSTGFLRGGIGGFLKGSTAHVATAGGSREVRIGVALLIKELGPDWLERNTVAVIKHLLDLCARCGPLAYTNQAKEAAEALHMRRAVSFILRSTLGRLLGEHAQITACKVLGALLAEYVNSFDYALDPGVERVLGAEAHSTALACQAALLELSALVREVDTAVTPLFVEASGIMEPVFACLLHPLVATRAATAWTLRCVTIAVPAQLTPLIDRCISRLEHMKASGDAISGYSLALAALLAGSADCNLGIPHGKPRQVWNVAEEMLKTAAQTSRLAQVKTAAGWTLIHAVISLGPSVMREHVNRVVALWKAAFPRSAREAEAERGRGDALSWACSLEARAGALAAMSAFATHCRELLDDAALLSMALPIECALTMIAQVGTLIRSYGSKMRTLVATVRVRLYQLLLLLPPRCYENLYAVLLRELVADVTLSDNSQSTITTSLLAGLCGGVDSTLLGAWCATTDQSAVETDLEPYRRNGMNPSHNGVQGAPENDTTCLVSCSTQDESRCWPEPLPPTVAAVDAALQVYARVFTLVPVKHRLQITDHFVECVKSAKPPLRQAAIQHNVLTAANMAMRAVGEQRGVKLDSELLQKASVQLVINSLSNTNPLMRAAAADTLGRLAQAVAVPKFVADMAQTAFSKIRDSRDVPNRSGYALLLGCLHKHAGSLGSEQHLNTGISVLLALAQEQGSPSVQAWAITALALVAETGGGMFRTYVEPVLSLCIRLLLHTVAANVEVVHCVGKLLSALITAVGAELQCVGGIETTRSSLLVACALQAEFACSLVQAEAVAGLQQLHLFAQRYVQLDQLVVGLCKYLSSEHLVLRKAAVSCLRQILQREAREAREHAQVLVPQGMVNEKNAKHMLPETGLEGALFAMLDVETDKELRSNIEECLLSLVQELGAEQLAYWLAMCKEILASSQVDTQRSTLFVDERGAATGGASGGDRLGDDDDEGDGGDDVDTLQAGTAGGGTSASKLAPRWRTRVFAEDTVQRLMTVCDAERAHFDLALAKELQLSSGGRADYLVLHLSDLVRMAFMGATSENTKLRLAGLNSLQEVITRFSTVPEPDFPGHVILEQFQAQVGAALRPAFADETPSHVTAAACQVCSTWIGSGVARDLNDLRRVHQLLVSSLGKLKKGSLNTQLYSESAATLERLAILKAWAEVYVTAMEGGDTPTEGEENGVTSSSECLLALVRPELQALVGHWLAALRDAALLALPPTFASQLPKEGGAYYKAESAEQCREYYRVSWPPILLAAATWLRQHNFELPEGGEAPRTWPDEARETRFQLMLGVCVDSLCSSRTYSDDHTVQQCLRALCQLLECEWCQLELMAEVGVAIEILNVLHRLILTRDNLHTQKLCADCALAVLDAAKCSIRVATHPDEENGNVASTSDATSPSTTTPIGGGGTRRLFAGAEGSQSRGLEPGATLTYAMLELALCLLVRQMPQINAAGPMKSRSLAPLQMRRYSRLPPDSVRLIKEAIQILVQIPALCSPTGNLMATPVVIYLVLGVLRESSRVDDEQVVPSPPGHLTLAAAAAMQALRKLSSSPPTDTTLAQWVSIQRSMLHSLLLMAENDTRVDSAVVMLAVAVVCSVAPRSVVVGSPDLYRRTAALFRRHLHTEHSQVTQKCLQSLSSLFARKEIGGAFVRVLGSDVFGIVRPLVTAKRTDDLTEEQLAVYQEALKAVEAVLTIAETKKRLALLNVLVQSLCALLAREPATEWRDWSPPRRRLHEFALARLNAIGPAHPEQFKHVLLAHPQVKHQLEASLLWQSNRAAMATANQKNKTAMDAAKLAAAAAAAKPAIQLKMDFATNFSQS